MDPSSSASSGSETLPSQDDGFDQASVGTLPVQANTEPSSVVLSQVAGRTDQAQSNTEPSSPVASFGEGYLRNPQSQREVSAGVEWREVLHAQTRSGLNRP